MTKLWGTTKNSPHPAIEKYTAGSDYVFDVELLPFDIIASRAHAKGLKQIGIITAKELKEILGAFDALEKDFEKGKVIITLEDEDCHTVIENYLVKKLGDTGKKIHTGRSRNDQVLVVLRLYMKAHLKKLGQECVLLADSLLGFAEKYEEVPMPGYSHTQQAMLGSVGHYFSAYAESLLDDAYFLSLILKHIDKNPLGSAAGFGTSIPIDRDYTTKELDFASLQVNTLYCQNSRGKFESLFLEGLAQVMLTLGRFASDLILFTSQEFGFFSVSEKFTTGSSIMPQKRNLDVMEILRGSVSIVTSNQLMVKEISKSLLSGYNRDLQLIKKPFMESVATVHDSIGIAKLFLEGITPNVESIEAKITPGIFAADIANQLVQEKGTPFRDAYKLAIGLPKERVIDIKDIKKNLASKVSFGAPGSLQLGKLRGKIVQLIKTFHIK